MGEPRTAWTTTGRRSRRADLVRARGSAVDRLHLGHRPSVEALAARLDHQAHAGEPSRSDREAERGPPRVDEQALEQLPFVRRVVERDRDPLAVVTPARDLEARGERAVARELEHDTREALGARERGLEELVARERARDAPHGLDAAVARALGLAALRAIGPPHPRRERARGE